jgi:hypothetical protein
VAWWSGSPWLAGYLAGGLMHLALDIAFNGQLAPRNIWAFYSFAHRARHRFAALALFGDARLAPPAERFWTDFFRGSRLQAPAGGVGSPGSAAVPEARSAERRFPERRERSRALS